MRTDECRVQVTWHPCPSPCQGWGLGPLWPIFGNSLSSEQPSKSVTSGAASHGPVQFYVWSVRFLDSSWREFYPVYHLPFQGPTWC